MSRASFHAFFSGGSDGSPVSTTPPGECNAITNRWFGESDLTLPTPKGKHQPAFAFLLRIQHYRRFKGGNYSFGNIMLIARQKPDATHVAGYRTWTSLGRFVRRGEKGIFILAPMVGNRRNTEENAELATDAKETQPTLYGFRGVYVFDITQTEGKELPTLTEVNGDVSGYREPF